MTWKCPATREAVWEAEEIGDIGCPICGLPAMIHQPETDICLHDGIEDASNCPKATTV